MRWLAALVVACACAGDPEQTTAFFDLSGATDSPATFFDHPFPSDLRLTSDGRPDLAGFPNPKGSPVVDNLIAGAGDRLGFSAMTVAHFRFDGPLWPRDGAEPIAADPSAPLLLIDIDAGSPERGRLYPTLAITSAGDDYLPGPNLALAPWPGTVLPGGRTFAAVVMRSAGDHRAAPLGVPPAIEALAAGRAPEAPLGEAALERFGPLFETLDAIGVDRFEVAAATVFTTADVVAELAAASDRVLERHRVTIDNLRLDADGDHPELCELVGEVSYPQFQSGAPPFNSGGRIEVDDSGAPIARGELVAPVRIAVPKRPMPAAGFPLMIYFHGSGGDSSELIDLGPIVEPGGEPLAGLGPASVVAPAGIASASSALPVNPERLPGATAFEYLNVSNLAAMRDTFRQGVFEQRLYLAALRDIAIDPAVLGGCAGVELDGAARIRFDAETVVALGLSMGGMYTNIVSAVEPGIGAAVPAGAGGFWNRFIFETRVVEGAGALLAVLLGADSDIGFTHPALQLAALAWEATEPMVYMRRLAVRPLPGHPTRDLYQPVGLGDRFFDETTFDAAALSIGTRQSGDMLWPSMQASLALEGRAGLSPYPVRLNARSESGEAFTGVVAQYAGDGLQDPHVIFAQLPEVKTQYRCFFASFVATGVATVPSPAASAACP